MLAFWALVGTGCCEELPIETVVGGEDENSCVGAIFTRLEGFGGDEGAVGGDRADCRDFGERRGVVGESHCRHFCLVEEGSLRVLRGRGQGKRGAWVPSNGRWAGKLSRGWETK